ncbi:precorrin-3B C(17)-methyltransferase [Limoniibacter endophyticus]|uniref:Precorrin-3B C(17)-methyltransferase n=1 Tax=Limoniibacter endophyticus TaxID=1565040 RepID=A0A8J3GIH4_9HYPH|nr:precorrin-3B C(17)-methyltransferase [Limoniibacter endophyticus]GHC78456.1 precorrin-3B C(17)-methyltransferase [Limoniibacter endophyticus]
MSGRLIIVGLGPGNPDQMTPEARAAIDASSDFFGYFPYVERLNLRTDQTAHASDNREELARAAAALDLALQGRNVCMVSGGDPGVFAMAAAVIEAIDRGKPEWKTVEMSVLPGITAMLAVAARVGAPLGHDFCAISLSDNLKPWGIIEKRLALAAQAGLVMAFYNPVSKARPWQLGRAFDILREHLSADVPVVFGRAAGRPDEIMLVKSLADARPEMADMATCVIVGTAETRIVERGTKPSLVYTPRFLKSETH